MINPISTHKENGTEYSYEDNKRQGYEKMSVHLTNISFGYKKWREILFNGYFIREKSMYFVVFI